MRPSERSVPGLDLLRVPVIGAWLRWRHARLSLQLVALVIAVVLVVHGLLGPDLAPTNLATVVSWVHYRGLLVVALLAVGNVFCTACPFVLVRDVARRSRAPRRHWPARLHGKWLALTLLAGVLFAYELFDLWARPRATAWLIVGYFGAALAIDLVFRGASFCKHLCPIGQFSFAASTLSPLEVAVRDRDVCTGCRTADCIAGRRSDAPVPVVVQRGCELGLFLPSKVGNLDCTFCLDCVQACPHDNVAITSRVPGLELADDRWRSSIGRLASRPDFAALAVLFTFGALLNAFAMTGPAYALQHQVASATGLTWKAPVLAVLFAGALVVAPLVLLGGAAAVERVVSPRASRPVAQEILRFAPALLPLGFGIWLAHYGFHLLTGVWTIVPVTQSAVADVLGWAALGAPRWGWAGMQPGAVLPIQIGLVLLGTIGSVAIARAIADRESPGDARRITMPWTAVLIVLCAAALWVLAQPMDMRGVEFPG